MLIDLSELLSVENRKQDMQVEIEMDKFRAKQGCYDFIRKEPVEFHFENVGKNRIQMNALIHVSLNIPCDRCLENVKNDFDITVTKTIDFGKQQKESEDMDEFSYIEDGKLDVERFVTNEILVNLPMKVLCNEDCRGICNRCGANLNVQPCNCDRTELDPRMSKILDVFNNFKEV